MQNVWTEKLSYIIQMSNALQNELFILQKCEPFNDRDTVSWRFWVKIGKMFRMEIRNIFRGWYYDFPASIELYFIEWVVRIESNFGVYSNEQFCSSDGTMRRNATESIRIGTHSHTNIIHMRSPVFTFRLLKCQQVLIERTHQVCVLRFWLMLYVGWNQWHFDR